MSGFRYLDNEVEVSTDEADAATSGSTVPDAGAEDSSTTQSSDAESAGGSPCFDIEDSSTCSAEGCEWRRAWEIIWDDGCPLEPTQLCVPAAVEPPPEKCDTPIPSCGSNANEPLRPAYLQLEDDYQVVVDACDGGTPPDFLHCDDGGVGSPWACGCVCFGA